MDKQMDMFDDGGLMQEGGTVDPESGNDVPVGSTQEEVRDDIPAQLSEGEFVLPADVVRYHGLEKIMELRDEAKQGLQKMEDMGQMGNSEEAILDDDVPFSVDDLEMEDDGVAEYQVGGYVPPQNVGFQQSQFANYQQQYQPYQPPQVPTVQPPQYQPAQQQITPVQQGTVPTFQQFTQPTSVTYYHADGRTLQIPVDANGNPLIPIPAGFSKTQPQAQQPTVPTTPTGTGAGAPQVFTEDDSGPTPEQLEQQEQYRKTVNERMQAAEELGYTNKQSAIEPLMAMMIPGGSMFIKPERGTVLVDGTIADGKGNSFDPITGEQVGFPGGMLGNVAAKLSGKDGNVVSYTDKKGKEQTMDLTGSGVTPAGYAGFRTKAGDQSIEDLLSGLPEETKTAKVETTLETQEGTAGEAAAETAEQLQQRIKDLTTYSDGRKSEYKDLLGATQGGNIVITERGRLRELPNGKLSPEREEAIGVFGIDGSEAYVYDDGQVDVLKIGTSGRSRDAIREDALSSANAARKKQKTAAEQARQLDQETQAQNQVARRDTIRNAKNVREERQQEESYSPYRDRDEVYTSNQGNTFNVSGIGVSDRNGNSLQEPGRGVTFASGYLTTDSTGKVTGAAIPGSQEYEDRSGGDDEKPSEGGCCFIMLEARYGNGTMDEVVRRYRDEYMTERNRRGYYKLAEVFVPLMRKYPAFKWLVTKTFADPLVSYGKYYYGQNKHGMLYSPVKAFWMKIFNVLGTDTEFVRENGEVV